MAVEKCTIHSYYIQILQSMGAGVNGGSTVPVVEHVAKEEKIGSDCVTIHLQSTEGKIALEQTLKRRPVIPRNVKVCKCTMRMLNSLNTINFQKRLCIVIMYS